MSSGRIPDLPINKDLGDTIRELRAGAAGGESGWTNVVATEANLPDGDPGSTDPDGITPVFDNNWVSAGGQYAPVGFYLSDDGEVRFRGHITGGSATTTVFLLPDGYRPQYDETFAVPIDEGGYAVIRVQSTGEVIVERVDL